MTETRDEALDSALSSLRIGIDAGSKTIKVVIADADGVILHSAYQRHQSNIRKTLQSVLHDLSWRYGNLEGTVAITGSAGISAAEMLGVPFVQEVVATTRAVRGAYPAADAVVELGGEDAKVIYLTGGLEQRMNATCAGGTGGFIDTIAFMLGVRTGAMSRLSMGASRLYPIASRCAVFAQTDVRPLLNAGAAKADIAASALDAVVRQTLGGLACGRPLRGTLVFLGGPFEYVPDLAHRFRRALGLTPTTGILPRDAHLFTALGAALISEEEGKTASLDALCERAAAGELLEAEEELGRLPALFSDEAELAAFRERHRAAVFPTLRTFDARGPVFLGVDAGSTTAKVALVDAEGRLVYSAYEPTRGDVLDTVRQMVLGALAALPNSAPRGEEAPWIAHATATGYGEDLLRAALGIDSGVVETAAHLRGAQALRPDVSFVLDIGGQDMKALWVESGAVADAVLNEACSSGCGALVSGMAWSMNVHLDQFVRSGLFAEKPVDLGTRCTVFMTSRVRHAQKVGASTGDISAGLAYSVVRNAVNKVIRKNAAHDLGENVVVQGGAFANDAVLRAFEKVFGCEAKRPDISACMGAYGAALLARDRGPVPGGSSLLGRRQLEKLSYRQAVSRCSGCSNACHLVATRFDVDGERRRFVVGNRCGRGAGRDGAVDAADALPDLFEVRHRLLFDRACLAENDAPRGAIGLVRALDMYETYPFWHALLTDLGFSVVLSNGSLQGAALETIPSESLCYPAKLAHGELQDLLDRGIGCVLLPYVAGVGARGDACPVVAEYALVLGDIARRSLRGSCAVASPAIDGLFDGGVTRRGGEPGSQLRVSEAAVRAIRQALAPVDSSVGLDEVRHAAQVGAAAMEEYRRAIAAEKRKALRRTLEQGGRAAILAGRPYHGDPKVHHGIPALLRSYGYAVLTEDILLGEGADESAASGAPEGAAGEAASSVWEYPRRLLSAAAVAARHPAVDFIELTSFGCGLDAAASDKAARLLQAAGKMPTVLKIDEMNDLASVRIRIRSMLATHEGRRAGGKGPSC